MCFNMHSNYVKTFWHVVNFTKKKMQKMVALNVFQLFATFSEMIIQ